MKTGPSTAARLAADTQRNAYVLMMESLGRLGWQAATAIGRYKGIIGARLCSYRRRQRKE